MVADWLLNLSQGSLDLFTLIAYQESRELPVEISVPRLKDTWMTNLATDR
jgi:hypothetical protein